MSTFIASRRTSSAVHLLAVDRTVAVLREHDRHFGADARAGRAVGLAVALVLHLDLAVGRDAVDVEEAEAQALHAVGAARVVDDREPRLPGCAGRPPAADLVGAVPRATSDPPLDRGSGRRDVAPSAPTDFEARRLRRQRGTIGRRSCPDRRAASTWRRGAIATLAQRGPRESPAAHG